MKKPSLLLMALTFSLNFNGCIQKSIVTTSTPSISQTTPQVTQAIIIPENTNTHARINTPMEMPIETTMPTPQVVMPTHREVAPSSAGSYHSLQTVQGPSLQVQERSNGFVFPQYQNKIVLLQLFGQNCEYCLEEAPILNRMKRKYAGNLQLIALQAQEPMNRATSAQVLRRFQMDYPVVDKNEAREILYFIQTTYGWTGILPYMLLIKNGVTEYSFSGAVSQQELDEAIRSLI